MTIKTITYDDREWQLVPKKLHRQMVEAWRQTFGTPQKWWTKMLAAAPQPPVAEGVEPAAWMHPDGRFISAATKSAAAVEGGALASAVREYTIPLARPVAESADAKRMGRPRR